MVRLAFISGGYYFHINAKKICNKNPSINKTLQVSDIFKIYKVYTGVDVLRDIHRMPIYFTKHAALMLIQRFRMSRREVRHYIKVARVVRPLEKDGVCGILQSDIGKTKIKFVCMVREDALWIITVEECK